MTCWDGPYIKFIWILLAKLKVKPVIWGGSSKVRLVGYLRNAGADGRAHRFHVQVGHVMLLAGAQALDALPQDGAAVEEVGQGDVDGSVCNRNHASTAAGCCHRQPGRWRTRHYFLGRS